MLLKNNWLTDGLIDFEYKKYILLAYLKDIRQNFKMKRLYPFLSDLIFHYRNLLSVRENKKILYDKFPKSVNRADFEKLILSYEKIVEDDDIMKEIESIVSFAIRNFTDVLNEGKEIYEFVEENVELVPIGLSPLYEKEGYMLINERPRTDLRIYRYQITLFEGPEEKYQGVHTMLIDKFEKSVIFTYEQVKLMLIKKYRELPNPSTYLVNTRFIFPLDETLLPVAKRLLVKQVSLSGKQ